MAKMSRVFTVALLLASLAVASNRASYSISNSEGPGRILDGIGGLSGGGATSVLLWTYPEPERSQILDYLFKPNFGANLQILKVEIGGDAQSTDGAESSHMHTPDIEDYKTGYEWWLMTEAKKRNPEIKLYGLPWAFPQWVTCSDGLSNCSGSIYSSMSVIERTALYVTKWVVGARVNYGLEIDYLGIWNERAWNNTYIKVLRETLDRAGCLHTQLVVPDGFGAGFAKDLKENPSLAQYLYAIGQHYPGTVSSNDAVESGKAIWASEDDSTYNNDVGAGCLARIINENYVNGNMTATINWNLIAAYQKGTNWYRAGLMTAQTPWPGKPSYGSWRYDSSWTVGPMIWVVAHTTQFTNASGTKSPWNYLKGHSGSGQLQYGGSYVTLQNPSTGDTTIVVEKMTRDHSSCVRPQLPSYSVEAEEITFKLDLSSNSPSQNTLQLWATHFVFSDSDPEPRREFEHVGAIPFSADGTVTFNATPNSLYTLTTVKTGGKGSYGTPKHYPSLFPSMHVDDFDDCRISGEARYFTDQNGIFQCTQSADPLRGVVMQQQVPLRPVTWGGDIRPHSLIGHRDLVNISLNIDGYITEPDASVMVGVRMQGTDNSAGLLFAVDTSGSWGVWTQMSFVNKVNSKDSVLSGQLSQPLGAGKWYTYRMDVNGTKDGVLNVWIDGNQVITNFSVPDSLFTASGFGLIGTKFYAEYTQYDNFALYSSAVQPSLSEPEVGSKVCISQPNSEVGPMNTSSWKFDADPNGINSSGAPGKKTSTISLRNCPSLCVKAMQPSLTGLPWWLELAACNTSDPHQLWAWSFGGIAPDQERHSYIHLPVSGKCLDIYQQRSHIGAQMDAWSCNFGANQAFFYDYSAGEIANEASSTVLGVC